MASDLTGILSKDIEKFWDSIKNAILKGNKKADFLKWYPLDHIKQRLQTAEWQCWRSDETYFFTCISIYPSGYKEFEILLVCGERMEEWHDSAWSLLKQYATFHGCNEIKFMGRPGWRKYGKSQEPDLLTEFRYRVKLCQAAH